MAVILKKKIYSTHNIEEIEFIDEEIYQTLYSTIYLDVERMRGGDTPHNTTNISLLRCSVTTMYPYTLLQNMNLNVFRMYQCIDIMTLN